MTFSRTSAADAAVLDSLRRGHPRLILTPERVAEIKRLVASDPLAAKAARNVIAEADQHVAKPAAGREAVNADSGLIHACGMAWLLTGDDAYYARLRDHVMPIVAGKPWDRRGFLSIGELAYALAAAYDWLHARWTAEERAAIRGFLVDGILRQGLAAYEEGDWWIDTYVNWNAQCNGGLIFAALAVADTDADLARALIPRAARWLARGIDTYEPEGAWPEGAGYWHRATITAVYAIAALESALGNDLGLGDRRGFSLTGRFILAATSPTGLLANFADCGDNRPIGSLAILAWMARRYGRPEYAHAARRQMAERRADAAHLFWYAPAQENPPAPPLDQCFRGAVDFASLRGAWDDPRAAQVWTKGGTTLMSHGHLDLGNFEFDALGKRWVRDLGFDDYGLPGYFDAVPGGRRWSYYRPGSLSHSVPAIDGANQQQAATARIVSFVGDPEDPRMVVEFSESYHPVGSPARRGLMLVGRRALLLQDEFLITKACRFTSGITTDAAIAIDGRSATLTLGGERLVATLLSPAGTVFSQESAERPPPEKPNHAVRRLLVDLRPEPGPLRVAILLDPCRPDGKPIPPPELVPLGRWG